jgi:hypothetical protein
LLLTRLEPILDKLDRASFRLLRTSDSVPAQYWNSRPGQDRWSPAEIIAHVVMVETSVIAYAQKVSAKSPKRFPLHKRLHLPLALVEARIIRRKTPIPLDPQWVREKEDALAQLRETREKTVAFIQQIKDRDVGVYRWPHPFLGVLNMYDWLQMIAAHELRHEKQMHEILKRLPKAI